MSRSYDNEKKPSQSTFSFKPTASHLQTRGFAPIQTDLDEDAPVRPSGYTENFLEKIINQRSTESSDTPVQTKPINRLKLAQAQRMTIQAKLNIGEPHDKYEQEADATASRVVQQINSPTQAQSVQREAAMEEEEELQMKSLVQRRENVGGGEASTDLDSSIQSARGGGQSLDPSLQAKMGQVMGADFSRVKVHTDSQSDQLNQSIQAKAFTTGQDVFFRQGAYEPSSRDGQELIAHELTHVVQQNGSAVQRRKEVRMKPQLQLDDAMKQNSFFIQRVIDTALVAQHKKTLQISEGNQVKIVEIPETIADLPKTGKFSSNKTKLNTPFKHYPAANLYGLSKSDLESSVYSATSMGNNVVPTQPAFQFMNSNFQGGGYVDGIQMVIITSKNNDSRTLLHEMGHYKQELSNFTQENSYTIILEYHNVLAHENLHEGEIRTKYGAVPRGVPSQSWEDLKSDASDLPPALKMLQEIEVLLATEKYQAVQDEVKKNLIAEYFASDDRKNRKAKQSN